jgi:polyisoprenoid-binding protein YceI
MQTYLWRTLASFLLLISAAGAQQSAASQPGPPQLGSRPIDAAHSTLTVRAFKTGLFSGFAHDHEVSAPIASGTINESDKNGSVILKIDARQLKVLDPKLEPNKRAEVQQTMHSDKVLDSTHFPNIEFTSTQARQTGPDKWMVVGILKLHGETHSVTVNVERRNDHYIGATTFRQRDFGITPISIGGGTVKVKDEVKIEFDILTR